MGALTLLITGAAGYVGRHTVAAARARGHAVITVLRDASAAPESWRDDAGITVIAGDLTDCPALPAACASADVVLHLAASLSGDATRQARDTLQATRSLLAALPDGTRLVHMSSMAVYDMAHADPGAMITENSALLDAGAKARLERAR